MNGLVAMPARLLIVVACSRPAGPFFVLIFSLIRSTVVGLFHKIKKCANSNSTVEHANPTGEIDAT